MRTYEELIAAQTELMHFNPNHDPKTGRFAKSTTSMGLKNLKRAKTSNLTKWGTSPENNVLYITGYSGSGKSTTARNIANKNDKVIHLDLYSDPANSESRGYRDKEFDEFLTKKNVPYERISSAMTNAGDGYRFSGEYWKHVDALREAIGEYGKLQYTKGNRVIVEGIQIADEWLGPQSEIKDKPLIVLTTGAKESSMRRNMRDGIDVDKQGMDWINEQKRVQKLMTKKLNELSVMSGAKRGQKYIDDFLSRYGDTKL